MMEKKTFTRIEQPPGSKLCLACVVAMLTGSTLHEVMNGCEHWNEAQPLPFLKAVQYLARRRWIVGLMIPARFPVLRMLAFMLVRRRFGAILFTMAKGTCSVHAVLWTGKEILDPSPGSEGRRLRDYRIVEWWPLVRVE
jgi:hypothetical protein